MSYWQPVYFFFIAMALALLEIQIEGKHGWAEKLPTWRWTPRLAQWFGRPVTGYHLYLQLFMLLLLHLPHMYAGFTWEREVELLSLYFLLSVFWDFLWFALNPHYGLGRFNRACVWWFRGWWCGVPADYFLGIFTSWALYVLPAGTLQLAVRSKQWAVFAGLFLGLTLAAAGARALLMRGVPLAEGKGAA
ncbi:MAG TPA: hypothetical protein VEJ18_13020 [Planctomycetota bacterium]|nr:hypothetical protein [Planctomycetota bacterium]